MNTFNIVHSYQVKLKGGYSSWYWAIDLHSTIFRPDYLMNSSGGGYYPHAKEMLQQLSTDLGITLILFTSATHLALKEARTRFEKDNINFKYINENPEITYQLSDFSRKFYFDVLLDDKAGFEGKIDWFLVKKEYEKTRKIK